MLTVRKRAISQLLLNLNFDLENKIKLSINYCAPQLYAATILHCNISQNCVSAEHTVKTVPDKPLNLHNQNAQIKFTPKHCCATIT